MCQNSHINNRDVSEIGWQKERCLWDSCAGRGFATLNVLAVNCKPPSEHCYDSIHLTEIGVRELRASTNENVCIVCVFISD